MLDHPLLLAVLAMNVLTFCLFGFDKWRARRGGSRTPEAHLLLAALFTGCAGGWLGMSLFRHKTRKFSFQWKMVLVTLLNGVWVWIWWQQR